MHKQLMMTIAAMTIFGAPAYAQSRFLEQARENADRRAENKALQDALAKKPAPVPPAAATPAPAAAPATTTAAAATPAATETAPAAPAPAAQH